MPASSIQRGGGGNLSGQPPPIPPPSSSLSPLRPEHLVKGGVIPKKGRPSPRHAPLQASPLSGASSQSCDLQRTLTMIPETWPAASGPGPCPPRPLGLGCSGPISHLCPILAALSITSAPSLSWFAVVITGFLSPIPPSRHPGVPQAWLWRPPRSPRSRLETFKNSDREVVGPSSWTAVSHLSTLWL